ncbi:hypothetical protein AGOR_G00093980 [Albula goreensis]|uniref:Tectonic domain-containing protein n=1 Tax=Albula goreensis TaxID=1534307 RepID=A0A8T3DFW5_9TELE|nr:hypothetical protein AGOR_G00093980 [Albula goreensis]
MNTLLLSRAFCFLMLILSDNRAVAQTTGSETSTTNPTKPSVTSDSFAESVTFITFPIDTQATTEFDNLVTDFLETVTPGVGSSTDGDTTTIYGSRDPDTTQTDATTDVNVITTEATTESNIMPTDTTISVCTCDLTPGFCDIGCCCDTIDCGINDLGSVFSGCEAKESSGVCIENWLMFRGNVDPTLLTVNDTFFCVRNSEVQLNNQQILPEKSRFPKVEDSFSFSQQPPSPPSTTNRDFYRVDDAILTHFKSSSLLSVLRQPSPGVASSSCVDRNPARFLRSVTLSCSRLVTVQSCVEDPGLKASSYVNDISLLRAPVPQNVSIPNFTILVFPQSEWPEPSLQNDSCLNVVKKVEYIIEYTSGGELTRVTVNVSLIDINTNAVMLQEHTVQYLLATPAPTPGPSLAVGLHPEALVFGRFGEDIRPLTVQGTSQDGECSTLPHARSPILLTNNYVTGCSFSSPSKNCSELRSQLFWIIEGPGSPDLVAMTSGPQPDWSRVITQNCSDPPLDDSCESGCLVPLSLTVQLLWAQQGLLSLPQIHILGAKFNFQCQTVKCPIISPLAVTTEVKFSDISVYPEPPTGLPQPQWKFPFGFFSRGAIEQDAGSVANRYDFNRQAWATLSFVPFILSMIL